MSATWWNTGFALICLQPSGICIRARHMAYRPLDDENKTNGIGQPGIGCANNWPGMHGHDRL